MASTWQRAVQAQAAGLPCAQDGSTEEDFESYVPGIRLFPVGGHCITNPETRRSSFRMHCLETAARKPWMSARPLRHEARAELNCYMQLRLSVVIV